MMNSAEWWQACLDICCSGRRKTCFTAAVEAETPKKQSPILRRMSNLAAWLSHLRKNANCYFIVDGKHKGSEAETRNLPTASDIQDENFTGHLRSEEYLDKLRRGEV